MKKSNNNFFEDKKFVQIRFGDDLEKLRKFENKERVRWISKEGKSYSQISAPGSIYKKLSGPESIDTHLKYDLFKNKTLKIIT